MRIDKTQVRQENERAKIADLRKDLDEQKNNLVKQQRSVDLEERIFYIRRGTSQISTFTYSVYNNSNIGLVHNCFTIHKKNIDS